MNLTNKDSKRSITVDVDLKTGQLKMEGFGFHGTTCMSTMKALEDSLTTGAKIVPKPEMEDDDKPKVRERVLV